MTPAEATPSEFPDALPIGSTLGDFTVTRVIGLGGFGIVYMAHDRVLERTVAIKEYLPVTIAGRTSARTVLVRSTHQLDTYTTGLQSFMREARLQAHFSHPALLEVYQVWEQNGTAYMAMRYYPGSSLRDLRHDAESPGMFDEPALRRMMLPVFDALEELHSQNVLHRDVSPDNILIMPSGAPVLLDFGSARTVIAGAEQMLTTVLKPGYAPLEQYADDGAMEQGPWTDVYGLAAVLHFLAIGSAPPQAVSRMLGGTLRAFEEGASAQYSAAFVAAVSAALAVKTQDRLQSVAAFRDALGWGSAHPHEPTTTFLKVSPSAPVSDQKNVEQDDWSDPTNATVAAGVAQASAANAVPEVPVTSTQPSHAPVPRHGPRLLLIGSLSIMALGAVVYFASTRTISPAPLSSAPAPSATPAAANPSPPAATSASDAIRPPATPKPEKIPAQKSPNTNPAGPAGAAPKTRVPGVATQTIATCDRLFAKLSLGNAALSEAEERLLRGCN